MKKAYLLTAIRPMRRFLAGLCVILLVGNPVLYAAAMEKNSPKRKVPLSNESTSLVKDLMSVLSELEKLKGYYNSKEKTRENQQRVKKASANLKDLKSKLREHQKKTAEYFRKVKSRVLYLEPAVLNRHERYLSKYNSKMSRLIINLNFENPEDIKKSIHTIKTVGFPESQHKRDATPFTYSKEINFPPFTQIKDHSSRYQYSNDAMPTTQNSSKYDNLLSETTGVEFSKEIINLSKSLNKDPVKIYNWVYNNIEFVPSFGLIQGADTTLKNMRGNAFDCASLLVSLLRYSGVKARYVHGAVEVDAKKVMNWLGCVDTVDSAVNLLNQGGIPNTIIEKDDGLVSILMEHIWVEAFIDYYPSRGIKNTKGDTWVHIDASYKQYIFLEPSIRSVDLSAAEREHLHDAIDAISVDPSSGSVKGLSALNIGSLSESVSSIQQRVSDLKPGESKSNVIGEKRVKVKPASPFAAKLPYSLGGEVVQYHTIPDSLQTKFTIKLLSSLGDDASNILSLSKKSVDISGKSIMISYKPETSTDEGILKEFMPSLGSDITFTAEDLEKIDLSLPGYLIRLIPVIYVDNVAVLEGAATTMGQDISIVHGFWEPLRGWDLSRKRSVAGELSTLALNLQGVSPSQISHLSNLMEITKDQALSRLSGEQYNIELGKILYGVALTYFSVDDIFEESSSSVMGMVSFPHLSHGFFSTGWSSTNLFGVPTEVKPDGFWMDITKRRTICTSKSGSKTDLATYNFMTGVRLSAMEHLIPQAMLSLDNHPDVKAMSTVKALVEAIKKDEGITVVNKDNIHDSINQLNVDYESFLEISNFVDEKRIAIVNNSPIPFGNGGISGYILIDQENGASGFKITGGYNGAKALGFYFGIAAMAAVITILLAVPGSALLIGLLIIAAKQLLVYSLISLHHAEDKKAFVNDWIDGVSLAVWGISLITVFGATISASLGKFLTWASAIMGGVDNFIWDTLLDWDE